MNVRIAGLRAVSDIDVLVLVLLPVALVMTGPAVLATIRSRRFLATAQRLPGEVVGGERAMGMSMVSRSKRRSGRGPSDSYSPVFRFTVDGQEHTVTAKRSGSRSPDHGSVEVLVPPGDPARARLSTFTENWLVPTILGGLALPFDIAAVVVLVLRLG